MPRSLTVRAPGFAAALILLVAAVCAGVFLSRASAKQTQRGRADRAARTAAATDSSAEFKLVYTGTYSYNYAATSDDTGAVVDQSSASYTWTYSGLQKLTATQDGNPLTDTGTFQMSSSGQQSETNDNFNCTFASGPHDTFPDTTISDPAVGREKATTPIAFSWDIDNPPGPPNATKCADGTSFSELSFPIPPGGSEVSPGSFFQPQDNALQAAITTGGTVGGPTVPMTVRYGQLPYTLPVSLDVPEHSVDTGYQTQSGSLQLEGKVTLSAVSNSCPVGTSASVTPVGARTASGTGLTVRAGSGQGRSDRFFAFRIKLSAYAGGACKLPYHFTWTRTDMPRPNVIGAKVTVDPKKAGPYSAPGSNAIQVTLTCQLSRARRRAINRDLTPCWGPVDLSRRREGLVQTPDRFG